MVVVTPFVLVIEKLETLLTPVMRDGRALGLDRGGRRHATKTKTMSAIRMPQHLFLFFIFGIWSRRCLMPVLRSYLIDTDPAIFVQSKLPLNDQHERWEPAANDVQIGTELNGWLPSAAWCG